MKLAVFRWWPSSKIRIGALACLISVTGWVSSCSIPNLESRQCTEARDAVKEFYSWYTGTEGSAREKQRDVYNRYISPDFRSAAEPNDDPFLLSDVAPTTFKIGKCETKDDSHVGMQVQLYWRQEGKTDQKEVYADVVNAGNKWQIDRVDSR